MDAGAKVFVAIWIFLVLKAILKGKGSSPKSPSAPPPASGPRGTVVLRRRPGGAAHPPSVPPTMPRPRPAAAPGAPRPSSVPPPPPVLRPARAEAPAAEAAPPPMPDAARRPLAMDPTDGPQEIQDILRALRERRAKEEAEAAARETAERHARVAETKSAMRISELERERDRLAAELRAAQAAASEALRKSAAPATAAWGARPASASGGLASPIFDEKLSGMDELRRVLVLHEVVGEPVGFRPPRQ